MGEYADIHYYNRENTSDYDHRVLSFVRWSEGQNLVVVSNFDTDKSYNFELKIPNWIIEKWNFENQEYAY